MTSKLISRLVMVLLIFFRSGSAVSGDAEACLLKEKKCMLDFPNMCLAWKRDYIDICVMDSDGNFFGLIENQKEFPEFYTLDAGAGGIYRGFLFTGNHGTGSSEKIFFGWIGRVSKAVDLAFLHSFTETGDSPYVRYRLAFSVEPCAKGRGLRWNYDALGAFTLCGVKSQWFFCDVDSFPRIFVCAREGNYIEQAFGQCAGAGDRFRSRVVLDKSSFSECQKDLIRE